MPNGRLKKREAQDRCLSLLAQGSTIGNAMKAAGRSRATYALWMEDIWFHDRAKALLKPQKETGDFVKFRQAYFGFDTPSHQQKIIDAIEASEPRSITMVLLPPGGGKTTVLEDWYCLKLGEDPDYRICVVSETDTLGKKILRNVSNRMTDRALNGAYIDRFGPFKPSGNDKIAPWNAHVLTHVQAKSGERDYSLEIKGAGSAVYGGSFDLIVMDDIQSSKGLSKTESLLVYFRQTLYSRIMRANTTGRIVIVGTRQGPGDFYEELLKQDVVDRLVKIPALDEQGKSYFPKMKTATGQEIGFSEEDLKQVEKVVGPEAWSRQYMQEPVSAKNQTFTKAMIDRCLDPSRGIDTFQAPGLMRIASLDPALGGHAVFTVAGIDGSRIYLLDGRNEEGLAQYEQMWAIMEELTQKWRPSTWIIEGNAVQGGIARSDVVQDMAKKYGFGVLVHQTGKNKMDDIIGVKSMAGTFLRREISIPSGDENARKTFAPLISELMAWREDVPTRLLRQDEVMALWFLHLHWVKMNPTFVSKFSRRMNVGGLPNYAKYRPVA